MKFKLTLHKTFEIDTAKDWDGDQDMLIEHLRDEVGVEPGDTADSSQIHDAIRSMLANDVAYVVDLSLDENDFEIDIPPGTTVEVPEEEKEED